MARKESVITETLRGTLNHIDDDNLDEGSVTSVTAKANKLFDTVDRDGDGCGTWHPKYGPVHGAASPTDPGRRGLEDASYTRRHLAGQPWRNLSFVSWCHHVRRLVRSHGKRKATRPVRAKP